MVIINSDFALPPPIHMKIVIILLIIALVWYFGFRDKSDTSNSIFEKNCSYLEPDNPYNYGSGHYAGYEWAAEKESGYCGGNSPSFIEGCKEYYSQLEAYESCLNK